MKKWIGKLGLLFLLPLLGGLCVLGTFKYCLPILACQNDHLSEKNLVEIGRLITVKILDKDDLGSGILIKKAVNNSYIVLTNAHVLRPDNRSYQVQTSDGKIYPASPVFTSSKSHLNQGSEILDNYPQYDLAFLQFSSDHNDYPIATIGKQPQPTDRVWATGFPQREIGEISNFAVTTGQIFLVLDKPLEGGYQIGYTNAIEKGMSGGPLLDCRGHLVGVNGKHAEPLWEVPSLFLDGSVAETTLQEKIDRHSWAISIETVLELMKKN